MFGITRFSPGMSGRMARTFTTSAPVFNSSFDQLLRSVSQSEQAKKEKSGLSEVDTLLSNIAESQSSDIFSTADDDIFGSSQVHPRDVAKNVRITGPNAGRSIDVQPGNVAYGLGGINSVVKTNKIRYLQRVQSRHIPPAKYRKQLKREWWRRKFSEGFRDLLSQVRDAKRRGY